MSSTIPVFKFHHLYNPYCGSDERGQCGVVTIATKLHRCPVTEKMMIFYGISICSPADNFSKAIGNSFAVGRLQSFDFDTSTPNDYNGWFEFNLPLKHQTILFALLSNILTTKINLPHWAWTRIFERFEVESRQLFL